MSEEILINVSVMETRVAVVENGVLQEIYIERTCNKGVMGNIYLGKVVRVLPGMQAAFVDIGLERASFIHVSDIIPPGTLGCETSGSGNGNIRDVVQEGQKLLVQVAKEPLGTKGARLTTQLSISSRNLVFMPHSPHVGISLRIEDQDERSRLMDVIERYRQTEDLQRSGFIVRTAAEKLDEKEIVADMYFLNQLWSLIQQKLLNAPAPSLIYDDLPLYMRTMRDLVRSQVVEKIRVDSQEIMFELKGFASEFLPEVADRIECYSGERPLFDFYCVEDEIQKALGRQVQLKSGGHIVIDQTEAMTTIDVNTGAFVGHRNLEETIFKTNLEAATALARQLRLRNLGGIIIIDFIDMQDADHKRQLHRTLEKALEQDHAKTTITGVSELGLVEMTRKRIRESLGNMLCEPCPTCNGRGSIKSAETVCYEIFREILREGRAYENDTLLVLASQTVVDRLLDEESASVADLEEHIGKTIRFQVETMYTQEQFDVVLL